MKNSKLNIKGLDKLAEAREARSVAWAAYDQVSVGYPAREAAILASAREAYDYLATCYPKAAAYFVDLGKGVEK